MLHFDISREIGRQHLDDLKRQAASDRLAAKVAKHNRARNGRQSRR